MDLYTLKNEYCISFPNPRDVLNVTQELMDDRISWLDLQCADTHPSVDISQFEVPNRPGTSCPYTPDLRSPAGYLMLPTELEMDLPLTPAPKISLSQMGLSPANIPAEQLSPVYRNCFVSEREQEEMEKILWTAERHTQLVLGFLLTEPVSSGPAVRFQPLTQALTLVTTGQSSSVDMETDPPAVSPALSEGLTGCHDFTESMSSEHARVIDALRDEMEDFTLLSPSHMDYILNESIDDSARSGPSTKVKAKSMPKTPPPRTPQPHQESQSAAGVIAGGTAISSSDDVINKAVSDFTALLSNDKASSANPAGSSVCVCPASQEKSNQLIRPGRRDDIQSIQGARSPRLTPTCRLTPTPTPRLTPTPTPRLTPTPTSRLIPTPRPCVVDRRRSVPLTGPPEGLDPLSSFMMLRSLQRDHVPVVPQSCSSPPVPKASHTPQPPVMEQRVDPDAKPAYERPAVTGSEIRVQETTNKIADDKHDSRVIEVQATESQWRAFSELRTLARVCLSRAGDLGLNTAACQDFHSLAPDHSRFLLKQQEKELSLGPDHGETDRTGLEIAFDVCRRCCVISPRAHIAQKCVADLSKAGEIIGILTRLVADPVDVTADREEMYNQAAVIHVLVTVKDLLLKCDLDTAVDFLSRASDVCVGQDQDQDQGLVLLGRRLQVLLFLSQRNQEPNPKILEMQEHINAWLQNGKSHNQASKVLVIVTSGSDCTRAMIIKGLTQATGQTVSALCPEEGRKKLDKAKVLNSLRGSMCVVVCGQHVGADFPWQSLSLVVEYDPTPPSPWASVCRERNICYLTFRTSLHNTNDDPESGSLEQKVPHTVFVTEGLLNCPLLLHLLESTYNMTVLERSPSQSLERLGGTHHYAVVTVDENTAVVIQEQDELCRGRACEDVVLRLTALSLQYSCCWLLIHCPDSQGGGLTSEGFNNLVLIYSSLVLFGLKSEDLDVKVLIVPEMEDIARWICQIAFRTLMSSKTDPFTYLSREWLSVMPSEEEKCLLAFPCVNPMVAQLMLSRAPSLQWLLGAPVPQLQELLPEVPLKVVKLFSEITSLYKPATTPSPPESRPNVPQTAPVTPSPPWITRDHHQPQHHQAQHHQAQHPQAQHHQPQHHQPQHHQPQHHQPQHHQPQHHQAQHHQAQHHQPQHHQPQHHQPQHHQPQHHQPQHHQAQHHQPQHHQAQHHQPQHHPQTHPGALDCFLPSSPCAGSVAGGFHLYDPVSTTDDHAALQVDLSHPFGSESSSVRQSWGNDNPWGGEEEEEEEESDGGRTPGGGRQGEHNWRGGEPWSRHREVYGSQREPADPGAASNPFQHASSGFRLQEPACPTSPSFFFPHGHSEHQHPGSSRYLTSPRRARPWAGSRGSPYYAGGQRRGGLVGSLGYGNHFRTGQERKRVAAGGGMFSSALTPVKRGKLSYEKVPGRSDGQTRLRFF
ncbi:protein shortage in chiasmata 1 ortholog [Osmerus mordax]|uniref:protein shortage in chiasmata 1 ortholog n=1 Tax=Osmerus mordax TaxID=8014 RepID=UPI00350F6143